MLTSTLEPVLLQERARVARELHDSVAQTLYSINLSAARVLTLLERSETTHVQSVVQDLLYQAIEAQTQLRRLLQDLWSDETEQVRGGFTAALGREAAELQTRAGCDVSVSATGEPDLAPAANAALVRISLEALRNIGKHARATHVDVVLNVGPAEVMLLVADDGGGFDPAAVHPGHFGLRSMREQARSAGGRLEVISAPGRGTHVRVRIKRSAI